MKHKIEITLIGLLLSIGAFLLLGAKNSNSSEEMTKHTPSMRGLCWVAGDSIASHNMDQISNIGTNWISQTPFGWMKGIDSPVVVLNSDKAWWGEADRGIRHTAALASSSGIKSMLKPHIWLRRSGDKWRSDIAMNSPVEWDAWFESYSDWILHYALLAEECNIEALCIGTELHQTTVQHPEKWREIIAAIRKVYSGDLTYAANWYKELEGVTFWDDLDYIGVQAYFPLSKKDNPRKKELLKSWQKHKRQLENISKKYNKKIVFTEIGYKNTADAAKEPWTWPQDTEDDIEVSDVMQRICYEALFESVWHESWFDGMFIWKWFHTTYKYRDYDTYFAAREERRQKRGRGKSRTVYFTPQHTETIETLSKWYKGENASL